MKWLFNWYLGALDLEWKKVNSGNDDFLKRSGQSPPVPSTRLLSARSEKSGGCPACRFGKHRCGQKNTLIEKEQIIRWGTDFIFLDAAGKTAWTTDF